jgi:hypothetical protein
MAADSTLSRSLHDVGLAAWFGGSLMGAVGLNGAAAQVGEPKQRLEGEQQRPAQVARGPLGRLRPGRAA